MSTWDNQHGPDKPDIEAMLAQRFEEERRPKASGRAAPETLAAVDAFQIYRADYPEPVFTVADLLTHGVTLFAGRPKIGKSWATLQLAVAVASGGRALGRLQATSGRVVYLALEEPEKRTHARLRRLVSGPEPWLSNIHFIYRIKPLLAGGAALLDNYLAANPAELVVVDTLLSVVQASGKRDVLRSDYNEVNVLRQLAEKHNTALLVVCHLRKMGAEYGLDAVAGTTGLTAACDAVWTLKRQSGGDCIFEVTGREMEEKVYGLRFTDGEPFGWQLTGEGSEVGISEERREILELLRDEAPLQPARIATLLRKNAVAIRRLLQKLACDGLVQKGARGYYLCSSLSIGNSGNRESE